MVKILGLRNWLVKWESTLNIVSQFQYSIDYPELSHTTSFWSSKTKYGLKKFISLIVFFLAKFLKNYLSPFLGDFRFSKVIWPNFHNFLKIYSGYLCFYWLKHYKELLQVKVGILVFHNFRKDAFFVYFHSGPLELHF